jgi:hypothetical protein
MVHDCLVAGGQSTASQLINWLRSQLQDATVGIWYTILFHKLFGGKEFHKFLIIGRPTTDHVPLQVINENLQIVLNQPAALSPAAAAPEETDHLESCSSPGSHMEKKMSNPPCHLMACMERMYSLRMP